MSRAENNRLVRHECVVVKVLVLFTNFLLFVLLFLCVFFLPPPPPPSSSSPSSATSDQDFVFIGEEGITNSFLATPDLDFPVLLESESESHSVTDAELQAEIANDVASPFVQKENALIAQNEETLAHAELLAHELGAPVLSELEMNKDDTEVHHIEHALIAADSHVHHEGDMEMLHEGEELPHELLEHNTVDNSFDITTFLEEGEGESEGEDEVNLMEMSSELGRSRHRKLDKANDYAYLDDPKHGGQPTALKNLKGLDIYVVNTPVADNANEIRPVKPPRPMSAALRARARRAAMLRKQLVHDIPQPKAKVKPKTRINTMSAYEQSLVDNRPLKKLSRGAALDLADPLVGGIGARQLKDVKRRKKGARFQQLEQRLPGTGDLPHFPKDPKAANIVSVVGVGSSFDNRDGPPVLLNDLLPLKAQLVEELEPLGLAARPTESVPVGWGDGIKNKLNKKKKNKRKL